MQISLRAARVNCEMTQATAAKKIGVDTSTISSWEKGKTFPTADKLAALCAIYGIGIDDIFLRREFS